jgi:hypothetical protein
LVSSTTSVRKNAQYSPPAATLRIPGQGGQ